MTAMPPCNVMKQGGIFCLFNSNTAVSVCYLKGYLADTFVLQQPYLHQSVSSVGINLPEPLAATGASPDRWSAWYVVTTHYAVLPILPEKFNLCHITSPIHDGDNFTTTYRAPPWLTVHINYSRLYHLLVITFIRSVFLLLQGSQFKLQVRGRNTTAIKQEVENGHLCLSAA